MKNEKKKAQKNQTLQKKISRPRSQPKIMTTNNQTKMATTTIKIHLPLVEKMKKDKAVKTQKKPREMRNTMTEEKKKIKTKMKTKSLTTAMILTITLTSKRKKTIPM